MKNKNHALVLLENGIHFSTIMNMSENQIKVLAEKFDKEESKEGITREKIVQDVIKVDPATAKKEMIPVKDGVAGLDASGNLVVKGGTTQTEGEMTEKFESKAQQGLFWARCNKCETEDCKWCKMAKEFSKSTSKKQYEKMPEKKHPEKTVKYKKKTTKENYEQELEDMIVEMLSNHINPKITKGDLKKSITEKSESMMLKNPKKVSMFSEEQGIGMKRPIGKITSMGKTSMEEQGTKEKERTKEREKTKTPTRKNPFKNPNPGVKEKPRGEQEKMKNDFIHWIKQALS